MSFHSNADDLAIRLERLEKSCLWWKRTGVIASIAALALLIVTAHAYSQRPSPQRDGSKPPALLTDGANATPVDEKGMTSTYTNFFRVTGTPEELVVDFGLNLQNQTPNGPEPVKLSNRTVMSFYTAKRMSNALQWAVNNYESKFGEIETDHKKRLRTNPGQDKP